MSWHTDCLQRRLETTRAEIDRVARKDHPGSTGRLLFRGLSFLAADCEGRIQTLRAATAEQGTTLDSVASNVTKDTIDLGNIFAHVSRVDSARIPFELVPALSWACSELLQIPNCQLLLRLSDQGYSIVRLRDLLGKARSIQWDKKFLPSLVKAQDEYPGINLSDLEILVIGIPTADARSVLLHALVAHELGHEALSLVPKAAYGALTEKAHNLALALASSTDVGYRISRTLVGPDTDLLGRKTIGWICELFGDMVAARLLGPPYLAAASRIFIGADAVASDTHPPMHMRRKAALHYLAKGNDTKYAWTLGHALFKVPLDASGATPQQQHEHHLKAETACEELFSEISALVDSIVKMDVLGSEEQYVQAYKQVADCFVRLAPAPQRLYDSWPKDSSIVWLLLSCAWTFRFNNNHFVKFIGESGWGDAEAEHRLDNLLLHSLRSVEIKHRQR